jgi:hypothetical protein
VLRSWNASQLQPCRPWSNGGSAPMQSSSSAVSGSSWKYVSTVDVTGSAEYCQDWQGAGIGFYVYTSPATYVTNTAPVGGIAALWLSALALKGTLALELRELRTATSIVLSRNALTGSLPVCWCACVHMLPFCRFS